MKKPTQNYRRSLFATVEGFRAGMVRLIENGELPGVTLEHAEDCPHKETPVAQCDCNCLYQRLRLKEFPV